MFDEFALAANDHFRETLEPPDGRDFGLSIHPP
jgi:hypothetical protein